MAEKKKIEWSLKEIRRGDLKPNPNNPKTRLEKGFTRLKKSIDSFGMVYDCICNLPDKNGIHEIIDGHSRWETYEDQDDAILKVFVPSRKLTKKEVTTMNAMFDVAVAGETDFEMVFENIGEKGMDSWEIVIDNEEDEFSPNLNPKSNSDLITDKEIIDKKTELESRFDDVLEEKKKVICPKCYNEFYANQSDL